MKWNDEEINGWEFLFVLFVVWPAILIVSGYVTSLFWEWFISPIFNLRVITIPEALGIGIFVTYFKGSKEETKWEPWQDLIKYFVKIGLLLLMGYIVFQCI